MADERKQEDYVDPRPNVRDSDRRGKLKELGFKSWFRNVFIFHYLTPTIGVLLLAGLVGMFIYDAATKVEPDFVVVVGTTNAITPEGMEPIMQIIRDEVGDANGDGEVNVRLEIYAPSLQEDDTDSAQELQALDVAFNADPSKIFFMVDKDLTERYNPDHYEYLSEYGFETEFDPFVRISDYPVFKQSFRTDIEYYVGFKGWLVTKKDDPEYIRNYDLAVRVLNRLLAVEEVAE